ncbi:hypothetical protein ACFWYW_17260 [Nonomuraea sp. NPDC059023]|uniref:hypothetical protein n=1 Tax=unclassified Nonomuraea TaxID=2593643 RepID=UPI003695C342
MTTPARTGRPYVISCAFALSEAFMGTTAIGHAQLLLTGRIDVWPGYWALPEDDRRWVCELLKHRGDDLASGEVFAKAVRELGAAGELDGYRVNGQNVLPIHGITPRVHADRLLSRLAELRGSRVLPAAKPGRYLTTLRGARTAEAAFDLTDLPDPAPWSELVTDAPRVEEISISIELLRKMARRIDGARGEGHRSERVEALLSKLRDSRDRPLGDLLRIRAGGTIRSLVAPTGFGKSVLMEVMGTLAVEQRLRMALVVPSRAAALALSHQIESNLTLLNIPGRCTPLVSPTRAMENAEKIATDRQDDFATWAYERLSYGCALSAAAETDSSVDAWTPGLEPCRDLRHRQINGRRHACPWRPSCGRFRLMRDAVQAEVIVTAHATFSSGSMHIPLSTDRGITDRLPVEAFLLRHCQLIVIDEVDQFQRSVIDKSARHLELAVGRRTTSIQRLDVEFRNIFGMVLPESDGEVRAILSDLRLLSEHYIANLVKGWTPPARTLRHGYRTEHWLVPRGYDAWLTARLLGLAVNGRQVTQEEVAQLQALFEGGPAASGLALANLDEGVGERARAALTATLAIVATGCRTGTLMVHKVALSEVLEPVVADAGVRGEVVDRLIRRAHLEPLRRKLSELFYHTPHLRGLGADAAETIADALGGFSRWEAMPASPLGRLFFAFKERYDPAEPEQTMLSVAAFGGDPHGYVRYLGELTARGQAGVPRAVLGLSATSYFPGAPHHHIVAEPTWSVPDTDRSGVTLHDARVFTTDSAIRISGVQGRQREQNLTYLAEGLYTTKLEPKLRELERRREQRGEPGRDRILVATTSYDSALLLAEGMSRAGAPSDSICLLARRRLETPDARRHILTADQIERFPSTGARILIAPLAVVERGVNILDGGVSALGAIYMIVRPVPILDLPAEMLAHINQRLWTGTLADGNLGDPFDRLTERMRLAGRHFDEIVRSAQYFRALPEWVQLGIVAEIVIGLIQLVGRARRGGTPGEIHLVDDAFFDPSGRSDFPALLQRLRAKWAADGTLDKLRALYGPTLQAFFDFAERMTHLSSTSPEDQP